MRRLTRTPLVTIALAVLALVALTGVALAASGKGGVLSADDEAVSGSNADRVAQVAKDYVKSQGISAENSHVESGDGGVAYEVEFKSPDGEVEVQVSSDFKVVNSVTEGPEGAGGEVGKD